MAFQIPTTVKPLTLGVLLMATTLAACEPDYGIEINLHAGVPVFVLKTCSGKVVNVESLLVSDESDDSDESGCSLTHASGSPSVQAWEYGKRPPGYLMPACAPLKPELIYTVRNQRPSATRHFKLTANGDVQTTDPLCD